MPFELGTALFQLHWCQRLWSGVFVFRRHEKRIAKAILFEVWFLIRDNLFGCCISFANGVPVNHIEERGDVVWTFVLIVEVVGVLPNVQA